MAVNDSDEALKAPATANAAANDPALEIREILRIVIERRWIILAAAALGLLLGIVLALVTTPRYRASALLDYDPTATDSLEQTDNRPVAKPLIANQELLATQIGLLRSETLARRVAEDLNLASAPAYGGTRGRFEDRLNRATAILQANTGVDSVKDSLLISVTETSTDPALAARIANALAKGFIATSLERRYDSSSYARNFLRDQLARTKNALEQSDRALNDYTIQSGVFRSPGQVVNGQSTESVPLSVTDLAALEDALNQARVKRIEAESAYRNGAADNSQGTDTAISTLVQQRASLQAEYAQDAKLFKPDYPGMQQLAAQIAQLDKAIGATRGQGQGEQSSQLGAAYRAALQAEQDLAAKVAAVKRQVQAERGRSVQYNILERDLDTNRELYDALLQRYKQVGVAGGISQSDVSLVDAADIPTAPYRPKMILNGIVGLLFGLVFGVAAAFAVHLLFDTIIDANDVREKLRLRVLGVIPMTREERSLTQALADSKSDVTEAYYSTLTAIKSLRPEGGHYALFVTSSRPAEGKSTTAFAIASSTARLGSRVLLIDADLRRPTLGTAEEGGLGFAHLLASGDSMADYIESTRVDNLSILPVGAFSGSAAELLSSVRLSMIVEEARKAFDLVVLDGPPVLGLTDAPLLSSVADSTVVVIESRKTRTSSAVDMVRRLREAGGSVLGVVLTKVTRGSAGYGYDYNYYTYSHTTTDKPRFDPESSLQTEPPGR